MIKEALSGAAIALTLIAYLPYIRSIMRGQTKPHVFSWVIWGMVTIIVFFAALAEGAGAGAWPIGVSGVITCYVAGLAYKKRADITITRVDWVFFLTSLASLPLWYFMSDPLWAVVLLTTIDILAFAPTFRKSYDQPYSEPLNFYVIMTARSALAVAALEHYSITTALFPASLIVLCPIFIMLMLVRRKQLPKTRVV